jgi:hypothetical protein
MFALPRLLNIPTPSTERPASSAKLIAPLCLGFFREIGDEFSSRFSQKETAPVNRFEGYQSNGAVVIRDGPQVKRKSYNVLLMNLLSLCSDAPPKPVPSVMAYAHLATVSVVVSLSVAP